MLSRQSVPDGDKQEGDAAGCRNGNNVGDLFCLLEA